MALKGLLRGDQCSGSFLLRDLLLFSGSVSGLCLPPSSPWLHLVSDLGPPSPPPSCLCTHLPQALLFPESPTVIWGPQGHVHSAPSWLPLGVAQPSVTGHLPRRPPDTCHMDSTGPARGPPWAEGRTWKAGSGLSQARAHVCSQVTPPLPAELLALLSCSQRPGVHVSQTGTAVASPGVVGGGRGGHTGMVWWLHRAWSRVHAHGGPAQLRGQTGPPSWHHFITSPKWSPHSLWLS